MGEHMPVSALTPYNLPVLRLYNTPVVADALRAENTDDHPEYHVLEARDNCGVRPIGFFSTLGSPFGSEKSSDAISFAELPKNVNGYMPIQFAPGAGACESPFPGYYQPFKAYITEPVSTIKGSFKPPMLINADGEVFSAGISVIGGIGNTPGEKWGYGLNKNPAAGSVVFIQKPVLKN